MARRATLEVRTGEEHDDVVAWYRRMLAEPARFPWAADETAGVWEPVRHGPTWRTDQRDRWVLPEATIGWDVLGWCGTELQHARGKPWRFTPEQARFVLWWYAVDETGEWLAHDGVLQRLKGWGKDPVGACLLYVETLGPCRVAGMDRRGPIAIDCPDAWVQTAATSLEQTKNTMRLMPGLITPEARKHYGVQVGKELIHAMGDERLIQAVTSSPATLEGARATFVLKNETHHWLARNEGHEMAAVIERNATKSPEGAARTLAITNAYEPSEDSVAQHDREAWETSTSGRSFTTGILYDSLEAPPEAPLAPPLEEGETEDRYAERLRATITSVVLAIRGDSTWLAPSRIVKSVLDTRNPPSRSRRFWYNQITAAEDAWLDPADVDIALTDAVTLASRDPLVLFFDGSKSDDATGLVACRLTDGVVFTMGIWQKPTGAAGEAWTVDRADVDLRVRHIFDAYRVAAFWADPSHAKDDDSTGWWDGIIDGWHRDYGAKLKPWAVANKHAVMWDMASPGRQADFTIAAERFVNEAEEHELVIAHHTAMRAHLVNARRNPTRFGVSLAKEHRESDRKIDLAVCAVGARMLARLVGLEKARKRTGNVW